MTMGQYKLVALDMDGTLLNNRGTISDTNIQAIREATDAGVAVCIATGRGYPHAISYVNQIGLTTPMVTVNGGEVWRTPEELHQRTLLDPRFVRQFLELITPLGLWYWAYSTEGVHNRDSWVEDPDKYEWLKFGIVAEDDRVRGNILQAMESWGGLEITNSSPDNLEVNPEGVNKASGIHEVCGLLGIEMSQVIAVGDSLNDLAMIREAGLGVAMGNAQHILKETADTITSTNEEDGVARVLREFVL